MLDLRMVEGRLHGIARYALELARRLPALAPPSWRFSILTPPSGLNADLGPLAPRLTELRCRAPFLSPLEQPSLAFSLARSRCDLFHATSFSVPLLWPGRLVATLHDANHLALKENFGAGRVAYYRVVVGPRARAASALLTVSEFSRRELARHLSMPEPRFQVISPGVSFEPPPIAEVESFRRARNLPARYFAVVGNPKPHKNLGLLAAIASKLPAPIALVAGAGTAGELGFPPSTIDLGALPERELPAFYAGSVALLMPSLYEGFGLPALEAMAAGAPVIASDRGSLPEVVGQAAVIAPATDPEAWVEAAQRLSREGELRRELIERGLERAARFTWDDCARKTLAVYRRVLDA